MKIIWETTDDVRQSLPAQVVAILRFLQERLAVETVEVEQAVNHDCNLRWDIYNVTVHLVYSPVQGTGLGYTLKFWISELDFKQVFNDVHAWEKEVVAIEQRLRIVFLRVHFTRHELQMLEQVLALAETVVHSELAQDDDILTPREQALEFVHRLLGSRVD